MLFTEYPLSLLAKKNIQESTEIAMDNYNNNFEQ